MTQNCILRVALPSVFVNFRQKPPKTVDFSQWCITYAVACCCSQQQGWVSSGFAAVAFYGSPFIGSLSIAGVGNLALIQSTPTQ